MLILIVTQRNCLKDPTANVTENTPSIQSLPGQPMWSLISVLELLTWALASLSILDIQWPWSNCHKNSPTQSSFLRRALWEERQQKQPKSPEQLFCAAQRYVPRETALLPFSSTLKSVRVVFSILGIQPSPLNEQILFRLPVGERETAELLLLL